MTRPKRSARLLSLPAAVPACIGVAWLAALALCASAGAAGNEATFFSLPAATHARSLAVGSDGDVWFAGEHSPGMYEGSEPLIGRVSPVGEIKEYPLPKGTYPHQLIAGPGGDLWFSTGEGGIDRFSAAGELTGFHVAPPSNGPFVKDGAFYLNGIAAGPDGNLWFTAGYWQSGQHYCEIGRLTPTGELTTFPLGTHSGPLGIVAGPDGNLWFGERGRKGRTPAIARITPGGEITRFPLPRRPSASTYTGVGEVVVGPEIIAGPDGNLWFGAGVAHQKGRHRRAKLGRITMNGEVSEFLVPGNEPPTELTAGPNGDVWFATHESRHGLEVDSIAPSGEASTPTCLQNRAHCELAPYALTKGPEDALWFAAGKRGGGGYGGGGSGELEAATIAQEAGFVGRFPAAAQAVATEP